MAIEPVNQINTNISALQTLRFLQDSTLLLQRSMARLASGLRIISPDDDPAGLAQTVRFDAQLTRTAAFQQNISNAISFSETQTGFLGQMQTALDRMSELSVLAQNDLATTEDKQAYQDEFAGLQEFISGMADRTFNDVPLFSGTALTLVTDDGGGTVTLEGVDIAEEGAEGGLATAYDPGTELLNDPGTAQARVEQALENVALMQGRVGGYLQRLNLSHGTLAIFSENIAAANSVIKDTNISAESAEFARLTLLVQSGNLMLSQSLTQKETLLQLINKLSVG